MGDMIYALAVLGLLLAVCLAGIKRERADSIEEYMMRLNSFRGIFALEIVIGHVVRYEKTLLYPLGKCMIVSVAFFLFVSAFGMVRSFHQRKDYLKGFPVGKILYLLLLILITYGVNMLIAWICPLPLSYQTYSGNILQNVISKTNWYLMELFLFYLLFYLVYRYVKRFRVLLVAVASLAFGTAVFLSGWIQGWYASILAFPAGILFGEYFDAVQGFMSKVWGKLLTGILLFLGCCSLLFDENSLTGMVYLRNVMCIAGLLLLVYFCSCFKTGNRVSRILGRYSTEIYLFQFVYLEITYIAQLDYKLRLPLVLLGTCLTALVIHPLISMIKRKLRHLGRLT